MMQEYTDMIARIVSRTRWLTVDALVWGFRHGLCPQEASSSLGLSTFDYDVRHGLVDIENPA